MLRKTLLCASLFLAATASQAQSVSGSWYGKADVLVQGTTSNYLTELILRQKGNEVEGVFAYYFKDSYQSFFVRGTYNRETREVSIKNLPMLLYASTARTGIECPMNFVGTLMVSQVKSSLNGSFYSNDKYKYTCPELRVSFALDNSEGKPNEVLRSMAVGKRFWKPQEEDHVIASVAKEKEPEPEMVIEKETKKPITGSTPVVAPSKTSVTEKAPAFPAPVSISKVAEKQLIERFEARKNVYSKDLDIYGDSIRITFYDNGDVDGDIISVFLDKNPVLVRQEITDRGTNIYLALDSTKDVSELSMFAENLGSIPPNTALMVITDGVNRYEIFLSSSLSQNATVRLRKKKIDPHRLP